MANWSAQNAIKAYLKTIKMGRREKEPDVAEFISALAGGNNAQLIVEVCMGPAGPTTLALVAAAQQTGGRVVCILPGLDELNQSHADLACLCLSDHCRVELVVGDPRALLLSDYNGADFVVVDCNLPSHQAVFRAAQKGGTRNGASALVVGYNAQGRVSVWNEMKGHFLPIGNGLLISRASYRNRVDSKDANCKKSKWVVIVDKCTGEEHVFRVTNPQHKVVQA